MKKILISFLLLTCSFQIQADNLSDSNQLFDWAEENYPEYFSPSGAETFQVDVYFARYYEDTDTYLGTSGEDVFIYGDNFGGLQHVGQITDFIVIEESSTPTPTPTPTATPTPTPTPTATPTPTPSCTLTCSSRGFSYSCGSGSSSSSKKYCYIGSTGFVKTMSVSYGNGNSVSCSSSSCGGALRCTASTGGSCSIN